MVQVKIREKMKRNEVLELTVAHLNNVHLLLSSTFLLNLHIIFQLKFIKISQIKSEEAGRRRIKDKRRFKDIETDISTIMCRRMFRMPRNWFGECNIIETNVGKEDFIENELTSSVKKQELGKRL